ncbi:glycerophosphodiester phosphodiesterase family protein [soil metagenome]
MELDVRITRDGELVVSHDAWFGDGRGVWETPAADRPSEVVVLDQALDACLGMGVNIEIKNSPGDLGGEDVPRDLRVCDLVVELVATRAAAARAAGEPEQQIVVSSFDEETLRRVRHLRPRLATAYLVFDLHGDPELPARAAAGGDVAVNPWDPLVDAAFMERCNTLGLQVNVWTVDDPDRIRELAELGVHSIITNEPANARAALAE